MTCTTIVAVIGTIALLVDGSFIRPENAGEDNRSVYEFGSRQTSRTSTSSFTSGTLGVNNGPVDNYQMSPWAHQHQDEIRRMAERLRHEFDIHTRGSSQEKYEVHRSRVDTLLPSFAGKSQEELDLLAKDMTEQMLEDMKNGKLVYSQIFQPQWFENQAAQKLHALSNAYHSQHSQDLHTESVFNGQQNVNTNGQGGYHSVTEQKHYEMTNIHSPTYKPMSPFYPVAVTIVGGKRKKNCSTVTTGGTNNPSNGGQNAIPVYSGSYFTEHGYDHQHELGLDRYEDFMSNGSRIWIPGVPSPIMTIEQQAEITRRIEEERLRLQEEWRKWQEEFKRKEEVERKFREEQRRIQENKFRIELEEWRRNEEKRIRQEEDRRRLEIENWRRQQEELIRNEQERMMKIEDHWRRLEAEKLRKTNEEWRRREEHRMRIEQEEWKRREEERLRIELEHRQRLQEDRIRREEEQLRQAERQEWLRKQEEWTRQQEQWRREQEEWRLQQEEWKRQIEMNSNTQRYQYNNYITYYNALTTEQALEEIRLRETERLRHKNEQSHITYRPGEVDFITYYNSLTTEQAIDEWRHREDDRRRHQGLPIGSQYYEFIREEFVYIHQGSNLKDWEALKLEKELEEQKRREQLKRIEEEEKKRQLYLESLVWEFETYRFNTTYHPDWVNYVRRYSTLTTYEAEKEWILREFERRRFQAQYLNTHYIYSYINRDNLNFIYKPGQVDFISYYNTLTLEQAKEAWRRMEEHRRRQQNLPVFSITIDIESHVFNETVINYIPGQVQYPNTFNKTQTDEEYEKWRQEEIERLKKEQQLIASLTWEFNSNKFNTTYNPDWVIYVRRYCRLPTHEARREWIVREFERRRYQAQYTNTHYIYTYINRDNMNFIYKPGQVDFISYYNTLTLEQAKEAWQRMEEYRRRQQNLPVFSITIDIESHEFNETVINYIPGQVQYPNTFNKTQTDEEYEKWRQEEIERLKKEQQLIDSLTWEFNSDKFNTTYNPDWVIYVRRYCRLPTHEARREWIVREFERRRYQAQYTNTHYIYTYINRDNMNFIYKPGQVDFISYYNTLTLEQAKEAWQRMEEYRRRQQNLPVFSITIDIESHEFNETVINYMPGQVQYPNTFNKTQTDEEFEKWRQEEIDRWKKEQQLIDSLTWEFNSDKFNTTYNPDWVNFVRRYSQLTDEQVREEWRVREEGRRRFQKLYSIWLRYLSYKPGEVDFVAYYNTLTIEEAKNAWRKMEEIRRQRQGLPIRTLDIDLESFEYEELMEEVPAEQIYGATYIPKGYKYIQNYNTLSSDDARTEWIRREQERRRYQKMYPDLLRQMQFTRHHFNSTHSANGFDYIIYYNSLPTFEAKLEFKRREKERQRSQNIPLSNTQYQDFETNVFESYNYMPTGIGYINYYYSLPTEEALKEWRNREEERRRIQRIYPQAQQYGYKNYHFNSTYCPDGFDYITYYNSLNMDEARQEWKKREEQRRNKQGLRPLSHQLELESKIFDIVYTTFEYQISDHLRNYWHRIEEKRKRQEDDELQRFKEEELRREEELKRLEAGQIHAEEEAKRWEEEKKRQAEAAKARETELLKRFEDDKKRRKQEEEEFIRREEERIRAEQELLRKREEDRIDAEEEQTRYEQLRWQRLEEERLEREQREREYRDQQLKLEQKRRREDDERRKLRGEFIKMENNNPNMPISNKNRGDLLKQIYAQNSEDSDETNAGEEVINVEYEPDTTRGYPFTIPSVQNGHDSGGHATSYQQNNTTVISSSPINPSGQNTGWQYGGGGNLYHGLIDLGTQVGNSGDSSSSIGSGSSRNYSYERHYEINSESGNKDVNQVGGMHGGHTENNSGASSWSRGGGQLYHGLIDLGMSGGHGNNSTASNANRNYTYEQNYELNIGPGMEISGREYHMQGGQMGNNRDSLSSTSYSSSSGYNYDQNYGRTLSEANNQTGRKRLNLATDVNSIRREHGSSGQNAGWSRGRGNLYHGLIDLGVNQGHGNNATSLASNANKNYTIERHYEINSGSRMGDTNQNNGGYQSHGRQMGNNQQGASSSASYGSSSSYNYDRNYDSSAGRNVGSGSGNAHQNRAWHSSYGHDDRRRESDGNSGSTSASFHDENRNYNIADNNRELPNGDVLIDNQDYDEKYYDMSIEDGGGHAGSTSANGRSHHYSSVNRRRKRDQLANLSEGGKLTQSLFHDDSRANSNRRSEKLEDLGHHDSQISFTEHDPERRINTNEFMSITQELDDLGQNFRNSQPSSTHKPTRIQEIDSGRQYINGQWQHIDREGDTDLTQQQIQQPNWGRDGHDTQQQQTIFDYNQNNRQRLNYNRAVGYDQNHLNSPVEGKEVELQAEQVTEMPKKVGFWSRIGRKIKEFFG